MSQDTVLALFAAAIVLGLGLFIYRTVRAALRGDEGRHPGPLDDAGRGIDLEDMSSALRHHCRRRSWYDSGGSDGGGD